MKILTVTSRSACFELVNSSPYYCDEEFTITLNGQPVRTEKRNTFSVFGLNPDTSYTLCAGKKTVRFKTEKEDYTFNVRDFNALGDGVHDDTGAFTAALACMPHGSTLYVPAGTYFLKPIFLKSGTTLYLEKGATLLGSAERSDYPVLPALIEGESELNLGTWQGEEAACFASLITAISQTGIKIAGEGVIDCNAPAGDWYINHRVMRTAWRPRGVFLNRCENVLLHGITVKNTPSWNIHPFFSRDVKLYDVYLENPPDMPTTDGVDADFCDGVEIVGVKISVGDDCVAIKSGTLPMAQKRNTSCKNVTIRNCLMERGHGGVVLGSELSGGIENITVEKCLFVGTDRGLRIKTRRGRGKTGRCDGITFENIRMHRVAAPFVVNMYYNMGDENGHSEYVWTTEKLPVDERTPEIGSITFKDMVCTEVEYCAGAFYGLPESPIKSVTFENVTFSYNPDAEYGYPDMREKYEKVRKQGLYFMFTEKVTLKNVTIDGQDGEPVILNGVGSLHTLPCHPEQSEGSTKTK